MLRRLLVTLLAVGVSIPLTLALLWAIDGNLASAQEDNCPPGFHWERMSGICCVQDYETIPNNGKIGYTGESLCEEGKGLVGIYERLATTDGKGPPGCPGYTSFAFLTACVTPQEFKELEAAGKLPGQTTGGTGIGAGGGGITRDAAERLYKGGSGPSPGDLAATGGFVAGAATLAAAGGWIAGGFGARTQGLSPEVQARLRELERRLAELDREITAARQEEEAAKKALDELWKKKSVFHDLAEKFKAYERYLPARSYAEWKNAVRADIQDTAITVCGAAATMAGVVAAGAGAAVTAAMTEGILATGYTSVLLAASAVTTWLSEKWFGWQADNLAPVPIGGRGEAWRDLMDLTNRMVRSITACRIEAEAELLKLDGEIPEATARWQKAYRIENELYEERQRTLSTYEADLAYFQSKADHARFMERIGQQTRWRDSP